MKPTRSPWTVLKGRGRHVPSHGVGELPDHARLDVDAPEVVDPVILVRGVQDLGAVAREVGGHIRERPVGQIDPAGGIAERKHDDLVVAADPSVVDDQGSVRRDPRIGVEERILGEVLVLSRLQIHQIDVGDPLLGGGEENLFSVGKDARRLHFIEIDRNLLHHVAGKRGHQEEASFLAGSPDKSHGVALGGEVDGSSGDEISPGNVTPSYFPV